MTVNFYLRNCKISIYVVHQTIRIRKSLGIVADKIIGDTVPGNRPATNKLLVYKTRLVNLENDYLRHQRKITKEDIEACFIENNYIEKDFSKDFDINNKSIFDYFDDFIAYTETKISNVTQKPTAASTIRSYKKIRNILMAYHVYYKKPFTLDTFDKDFYENFRKFAFSTGKMPNTIGENIKIIKTFCQFLQDEIPTFPNYFRKYKIIRVPTEAEPLRAFEITKLYNASDLSPLQDKARWILLFLCSTGMRISDYNNLHRAVIDNDFIEFKAIKTNVRCYIPLIDDDVFKPKELYILLTSNNGFVPKISGQKLNVSIKEMAVSVGITRIVPTSKTGRKTFATLKLLKGIAPEVIMKTTGHKTRAAFDMYVGIDRADILKAHRA